MLAGLVVALSAAGCLATGPGAAPASTSRIPAPADAAVQIGASGAGFDDGAALYAYTSTLPPQQALARYGAQLLDQGYVTVGSAQGWQLYRGHGLMIAVSAGPDGPPTDLLVRVASIQSQAIDGASPTSAATSQPTDRLPPGQAKPQPTPQGPPQTPPGQQGPPPPHGGGGSGSPGKP